MKTCQCGKKSISGLKRGVALCQYHYNAQTWGKQWADQMEEAKKENIKVVAKK
ncbi:hypothetical protein bas61_0121 [Escherichia phage EmilieFrey]|nr:hypothetical protein bas61_0121 [Escherichia phage EmilieFrey]